MSLPQKEENAVAIEFWYLDFFPAAPFLCSLRYIRNPSVSVV